ncbi:hypothetical protein GGP96_002577 [Salinibacter ruber]|uniref:Uncharacterized protein n=1 Tax=Salinibacter ruber TaxID=146919 RepID=A0A9X2U504_9BACT|nr:hypothetical protein [Salinibacter ruber]MCS3867033.1 hypothetical protein [Salinibacter ruber]MCS4152700.1 hypothetical protein [Salinibacter ruber]MCS4177837.1 hypothetical protein [Salinibacter ruber]
MLMRWPLQKSPCQKLPPSTSNLRSVALTRHNLLIQLILKAALQLSCAFSVATGNHLFWHTYCSA